MSELSPEKLAAAGLVEPLDLSFAQTLARLGNEQDPLVLAAAALASRQTGQGHVCVDLRQVTAGHLDVDAGDATIAWPKLSTWLEALRHSELVSRQASHTPLALDTAGRLYLQRYWQHQQRLAGALAARAYRVRDDVDGELLASGLQRLFGARDAGGIDWQRCAAATAVLRDLTVITGGPGTGKTSTVVKILALLAEQATRANQQVRMALLAPTGKAASRLADAVRRAKSGLRCGPEIKAHIPDAAATIHRALGRSTKRAVRHDASNPLLADVVVVDEASMVDLALMDLLADAVAPQARLILLGDKDQLASVEAGAVLGDICGSGTRWSYSQSWASSMAQRLGMVLPSGRARAQHDGIHDSIVELTHTYRFGDDSGIGALAAAVRAGDWEATRRILESSEDGDVTWVVPTGASAQKAIQRWLTPRLQEYGAYRSAQAWLTQLGRFRVLCAHRRGAAGVEWANRVAESVLQHVSSLHVGGTTYAGRPILVTENAHSLSLFNGDVGVIAAPSELEAPAADVTVPDEQAARRQAFFAAGDETLRGLAPSRLPTHQTVFAMSIHRSQGSEFDDILVLLPPKPSPILSRELVYTALTRARRHVTLVASPEVLRLAVQTDRKSVV